MKIQISSYYGRSCEGRGSNDPVKRRGVNRDQLNPGKGVILTLDTSEVRGKSKEITLSMSNDEAFTLAMSLLRVSHQKYEEPPEVGE